MIQYLTNVTSIYTLLYVYFKTGKLCYLFKDGNSCWWIFGVQNLDLHLLTVLFYVQSAFLFFSFFLFLISSWSVKFDVLTVVFVVMLIPVFAARMCVHRGGKVNLNIDQELNALVEEERRLDEMIQNCTRQVHQLCENQNTQRYPFIVISASLLCCCCCDPNSVRPNGCAPTSIMCQSKPTAFLF